MDDVRPVGFAVIGLGMGRHHVRSIDRARGARLVGVCDIREDRRSAVAKAAGCKAWADMEAMLADPEVEVVNVCTPSGTHADVTRAAALAGKHVLCEKPLDIKVERIDSMVEVCREQGVRLGGIFQRRTEPLYQEIHRAVREDRLGKLALIDVSLRWYRAQSYYDADGGWRGTWALDGGGSLMNQGVHSVDILRWIGGPVRSVAAQSGVRGHSIETEDVTVAAIQFENGALGSITTTTCAYPGLYEDLNLHGSLGSIRVEDGKLKTWKFRDGDQVDTAGEAAMMARYGDQPAGSGSADPMAVGLDGHEASSRTWRRLCAMAGSRSSAAPRAARRSI
ncbi:MAG: Gfo/Idh/MocA family oxidoreductase [Chloroflexi bacterium]|nr:Gfo/Idh/MocA family oxidoreductase [Chloroflexota bacterium]